MDNVLIVINLYLLQKSLGAKRNSGILTRAMMWNDI